MPPNKPFPEALRFDSEPLPEEEVIALWAEYLSDTRTLGSVRSPWGETLTAFIKLCSDGTGRMENVTDGGVAGTWEVRQTVGDWNRVAVYLDASLEGNPDAEKPIVEVQIYGHDENGILARNFDTLGIGAISPEECQSFERAP